MRQFLAGVVLLVLATAPATAGNITREKMVEAAVGTFGLVTKNDFKEIQLDDGTPAVKAYRKDNGVIVLILGPENAVHSVRLWAAPTDDMNGISTMLMMSSLAAEASEWPGAVEWVTKTATNIAKSNGGKEVRTVNGHEILVQMAPPNLIHLSVDR